MNRYGDRVRSWVDDAICDRVSDHVNARIRKRAPSGIDDVSLAIIREWIRSRVHNALFYQACRHVQEAVR